MHEKIYRAFTDGLEHALQTVFGQKMGWALICLPFNEDTQKPNMTEYLSNIERSDVAGILRQVADSLEREPVMPPTIGCA